MEHLLINLLGKTRRASLHGREHIVAPLSLIVPGVLNGSKGALYYPPEEIGRDPTIWNHVPLVVYHPNVGGQNVSARDPDVLNSHGIGIILKTKVDNKGRLVAEGWFDVERCRKVDNRVLQSLEAGKAIELSTGLFTDNHPAPQGSVHNGRSYQYIARNYRPDHLAILPDQKGACSLDDGCGVMVNAKGDDEGQWITMSGTHVLIKGGEVVSGPKVLKDLSKKGGGGGKAAKDKDVKESKQVAKDKAARYAKRDARHEREAQRDIKRGDKVVSLGSGAAKKPAPAAKPAEKKSLWGRLKSGLKKAILGPHGLGFNSALGSGRLIANAEQRDDDGKFTGAGTADSAGAIPTPKNTAQKKSKKPVKAAAGDSAEAQTKIEQVGNLMLLGSGTVNGGPGSGPRKGGGGDSLPSMTKLIVGDYLKEVGGDYAKAAKTAKETAARMGSTNPHQWHHALAAKFLEEKATTNSRLYDCEEDCDDDEDCIDDCLENNVESVENGGPGSGPQKGGGSHPATEALTQKSSEIEVHKAFGDIKKTGTKEQAKEFLEKVEAHKGRAFVHSLANDHGVSLAKNPGGKGTDLATPLVVIDRLLSKTHPTENASIHQSKCPESGKYLKLGAGVGKGEPHASAKAGAGNLPGQQDEEKTEEELMLLGNGGPGSGPRKGGGAESAQAPEDLARASKAQALSDKANDASYKAHGGTVLLKHADPELAKHSDRALQHANKANAHQEEGGSKVELEELPRTTRASIQKAHTDASDSHEAVAKGLEKSGNTAGAKLHAQAGRAHLQAAMAHQGVTFNNQSVSPLTNKGGRVMPLTKKQRSKIVANLCTNCDCQKANVWNEEDAAALSAMSDDRLLAFAEQRDAVANAEYVMNALAAEYGEEIALNEIPAFIKKKAAADPEAEVEEEEDPEMEAEAEEEVPEEEAEAEEEPVAKKKPPFIKNQRSTPVKPVTVNEWMATAPPEIRSAVSNAMQIEAREKGMLIEQLTGNVAEDSKAGVLQVLNTKSLDELRILSSLVPQPAEVTNTSGYAPAAPLYFGASAPTSNGRREAMSAAEKNDILPLPVVNWAEERKLQLQEAHG
jgi:hypothetical protein